jgi:cysteinyl-tRNA synthetase
MLAVLALDNLLEEAKPRPPADVLELAQLRESARQDRNYNQADNLRERIEAMGWEVRDGPSGPELLPARK